jgi:hypothetical protein
MAKNPQGNPGKQKISLAPVKALSNIPAATEPSAPVLMVPKTATTARTLVASEPAVVKNNIAASVKSAESVPVTATAAPAMTKPSTPVSQTVKVDTAKTVVSAAKPVAAVPAPVVVTPVPAPKAAVVSAPKTHVIAAAPRVAEVQPVPAISFSIVPMHPGLTDFDAETWFAPAVNAFRTLAAVQAKMLEHACAELKASLDEAGALVRAASPSEAAVLQTKAFSRRLNAGSAHLADLATTARKTGKAA